MRHETNGPTRKLALRSARSWCSPANKENTSVISVNQFRKMGFVERLPSSSWQVLIRSLRMVSIRWRVARSLGSTSRISSRASIWFITTCLGVALRLAQHGLRLLSLLLNGIVQNHQQRFIILRHLFIHAGGLETIKGVLGVVDDRLKFIDHLLVVIHRHATSRSKKPAPRKEPVRWQCHREEIDSLVAQP